MNSLDVVAEKVKEHDRRLSNLEDMTKETADGAADLLVVSTQHSEQINTLKNVVYGGLGLALTTVLGILLKSK